MPKVALVAVADRAVRKYKDQQKQAFSHIFEKPLLQTVSRCLQPVNDASQPALNSGATRTCFH
jgi:hypothetical protein